MKNRKKNGLLIYTINFKEYKKMVIDLLVKE